MTKRKATYDIHCHALANHFLSDEPADTKPGPEDIEDLAITIQQAIEDWIGTYRHMRIKRG